MNAIMKICAFIVLSLTTMASFAMAEEQTDLQFVASVLSSEKVIGETLDQGVLDVEGLLTPVLNNLGPAPEGVKIAAKEVFREKLIAELSQHAYENQLQTLPQVFSEAELEEVAAFMRTPSGRVWAENQLLLVRTNNEVAVSNGKKTAAKIAGNILKDLKEKGPEIFTGKNN